MRTLRLRRHRGQAAVELALLSIVVVPVFLYIIFLDDLLRYKQDQQEAMISAGWDFSTLNFDHQTNTTPKHYLPNNGNLPIERHVTYYNRLSFGDHTASTPRFENPNSKGEAHHLGVGAHQCWLVGGANNQVTCSQGDANIAANFTVDGTGVGPINARIRLRNFVANGTGGLYSCTGRVGVTNAILPTGILAFSKEELSSRKYHGANASSQQIGFDGKGTHSYTNAAEAYHFPADTFAIVTHPWAMTDAEEISANGSKGPNPLPNSVPVGPRYPFSIHNGKFPLYDRVVQVYNSGGPVAAITSATIYPVKAMAKQLISPAVIIDQATAISMGDLMLTPEVAFRKSFAPTVGDSDGSYKGTKSTGGTFYSSQYWDFASNDVSKHYTNRGSWYLGAKSQP